MNHTRIQATAVRRVDATRGFTLIELLVVISIIGVLSSVVLASLASARAKGRFAAALTIDRHTYAAFYDNRLVDYSFDSNETTCGGGNLTVIQDGTGNSSFNLIPVSGNIACATARQTDTPFGNNSLSAKLASIQYKFTTAPLALNPVLTKGFTISVWLKYIGTPAGNSTSFIPRVSFTNNNSLSETFALQISTSGSNNGLYTMVGINSSTAPAATPTIPMNLLNDQSWHHVIVSFDANNAIVTTYFDGYKYKVENATSFSVTWVPAVPYSAINNGAGGSYAVSMTDSNLLIDHLVIYNNVLP